MRRSKQSNEILDIIKASECFSMGGYGLIELALRELDDKIAEYESNKHYIELGKAVEKAFDEGYTLTKNPMKFVSAEIKDALHLLKWHELINIVEEEDLLEWAEGRE